MQPKKLTWLWPALLSLVISAAYIGIRLVKYNFDPVELAEIGTRFSEVDPQGEPGYDGQFSYYMARDLAPDRVSEYLDVPAYRYQRILYPLLARVLALGRVELVPWTLLGLNWVVHSLATLGVCWVLRQQHIRVRYALIYGLWVGLIASVGLDLHESLAYGLIVGAWVMRMNRRDDIFAILLCLALFAKETSLLFWAAAFFPLYRTQGRRSSLWILLSGGFLYLLWQVWLWQTFGKVGIASGGDMATGFEWIPLMGIIRIAFINIRVFGLFLLIFGPMVILPALWGLVVSWNERGWLLDDWALFSLFLHGLLILFLPFSTFREPLGLVRIATGMVLSVLIVASKNRYHRVLNYGMFWIVLLAMLIPQS